MKTLSITIDYSAALEKCKLISSFEGRGAVNAAGESIYEKLKITNQDEVMIKSYLKEACQRMEPMFGHVITDSQYTDTNTIYTIRYDNSRWSKDKSFTEVVKDTAVMYAMYKWFTLNGEETKSKNFQTVFEESSSTAMSVLFSKKKPIL